MDVPAVLNVLRELRPMKEVESGVTNMNEWRVAKTSMCTIGRAQEELTSDTPAPDRG